MWRELVDSEELAPAPWFWHRNELDGTLRLMSDSVIGDVLWAMEADTPFGVRSTVMVCGPLEAAAIAAAPTMLAALEKVLKRIIDGEVYNKHVQQEVELAIALAKGELDS